MNPEDAEKRVNELVTKCWEDEGFKQKLMADPVATLKAQGVELPPGMKIQVVENTDQAFTLVIPPKPEDLSDEELDMAVGGVVLKQYPKDPKNPNPGSYTYNSTIYYQVSITSGEG
jgi:hypothetical protein